MSSNVLFVCKIFAVGLKHENILTAKFFNGMYILSKVQDTYTDCTYRADLKEPLLKLFKPNSALLVVSYCALRMLACRFCVGRGEVSGVTCRVTCTWWLLGLAVKAPWLGPHGPILALAAWTGLVNAILTL